jgi:myo-inositol-1(or 4)-monophosphatase
MSEIASILQHALTVAVQAAKVIQEAAARKKEILTKENHADLVTETDKGVEEIIKQYVSSVYPDHLFVGEESASKKVNQLQDQPTWIIDPVDGT